MNAAAWVLVLNALSTFYLMGLVWTVQRVHYPAFHRFVPERFIECAAIHRRDITPVVAPFMVVELLASVGFVFLRPAAIPAWVPVASLVPVGVIWISTFVLQVPLHTRLSTGFDADAIQRLVWTNWLRTVAWTARAAMIAWALVRVLSRSGSVA